MSSLHGFGLGIVSVNAQGETLDTYYPAPIANVNGDEASALREVSGSALASSPFTLAMGAG